LWHDIQHGLFHFDSGILFTIKELFTRPGHTIREFIEGKRVKHFRPLSLIIVISTIYGLLFHYFHVQQQLDVKITGIENAPEKIEKLSDWMATHYAWVTLLTIPFYAVGSFFAFKKQGYNFIEHCVLNSFLAAQRLIVHIAAFPVVYLFNNTPGDKVVNQILVLLDFVLVSWSYSQFFNKLSKRKAILLTGLSYLIAGACIVVVAIIAAAIGISLYKKFLSSS
jgi:hypothetical protein